MSSFSEKPKEGMKAVCANCKQTYIKGDKYCRCCGAPLGDPVYIPLDFDCIYGPLPMDWMYECSKCGYIWTMEWMGDIAYYCPKCGGYVRRIHVSDVII
ncbi:MAG: zinc ribbon domain-containing protein [Solobacterium sp.]|nr:zinc ribbon domain-containing protein [Solobacterium sp.]